MTFVKGSYYRVKLKDEHIPKNLETERNFDAIARFVGTKLVSKEEKHSFVNVVRLKYSDHVWRAHKIGLPYTLSKGNSIHFYDIDEIEPKDHPEFFL